MSQHNTSRTLSCPAYGSLCGRLSHLPISLIKQSSKPLHVSSPSIGHNIVPRSPWALYQALFLRRTTASDRPSNVRLARARAIWTWNALIGHIVQSASPDLTQSNNVNTTCSTAQRRLRFARSSLGIHNPIRTSDNPTEIMIMSVHDHHIGNAVTTTATATTTEGDRMTTMTVTAMTNTEQMTIMIGTRTAGMTDTIRGIHVMIG